MKKKVANKQNICWLTNIGKLQRCSYRINKKDKNDFSQKKTLSSQINNDLNLK